MAFHQSVSMVQNWKYLEMYVIGEFSVPLNGKEHKGLLVVHKQEEEQIHTMPSKKTPLPALQAEWASTTTAKSSNALSMKQWKGNCS